MEALEAGLIPTSAEEAKALGQKILDKLKGDNFSYIPSAPYRT